MWCYLNFCGTSTIFMITIFWISCCFITDTMDCENKWITTRIISYSSFTTLITRISQSPSRVVNITIWVSVWFKISWVEWENWLKYVFIIFCRNTCPVSITSIFNWTFGIWVCVCSIIVFECMEVFGFKLNFAKFDTKNCMIIVITMNNFNTLLCIKWFKIPDVVINNWLAETFSESIFD